MFFTQAQKINTAINTALRDLGMADVEPWNSYIPHPANRIGAPNARCYSSTKIIIKDDFQTTTTQTTPIMATGFFATISY